MCNKNNNYQKPAMKVVRLQQRIFFCNSAQTDPVGARESRDGSWDDKE